MASNQFDCRWYFEWILKYAHCLTDGPTLRNAPNFANIDLTFIRGIAVMDAELPTPEQDRIDCRAWQFSLCEYMQEVTETFPGPPDTAAFQRMLDDLGPAPDVPRL